jgi:hypothetical protein
MWKANCIEMTDPLLHISSKTIWMFTHLDAQSVKDNVIPSYGLRFLWQWMLRLHCLGYNAVWNGERSSTFLKNAAVNVERLTWRQREQVPLKQWWTTYQTTWHSIPNAMIYCHKNLKSDDIHVTQNVRQMTRTTPSVYKTSEDMNISYN